MSRGKKMVHDYLFAMQQLMEKMKHTTKRYIYHYLKNLCFIFCRIDFVSDLWFKYGFTFA